MDKRQYITLKNTYVDMCHTCTVWRTNNQSTKSMYMDDVKLLATDVLLCCTFRVLVTAQL